MSMDQLLLPSMKMPRDTRPINASVVGPSSGPAASETLAIRWMGMWSGESA